MVVPRYQGAGPSLTALSATLIAVQAGQLCYCQLNWTSFIVQRNCGSTICCEIKVIQSNWTAGQPSVSSDIFWLCLCVFYCCSVIIRIVIITSIIFIEFMIMVISRRSFCVQGRCKPFSCAEGSNFLMHKDLCRAG